LKNKVIILFAFIGIISLSCQTEQEKVKLQVDSFGTFADSLLAVNQYYVAVLYGDTELLIIDDPLNPEIAFNGKAIKLHSNIFDTATNFTKTEMANVLEKYNNLAHNLDLLTAKMDKNTVSKFEMIKDKINQIKKPIK
jgi:hypothetical protein